MTSRGNCDKKSLFQMLLLSSAMAFTAGTTWAQEAADEEEDSAELDRVAVTGSRIKRSELEGPAPVLVIDQQDMNERGYTTVFEALQDLSINNGYKFEGAESALFTPDVQTINLRGFGVGTTLTLINGRRLANYPAAYQSNASVFSYGSIPVAAIERIEILATGASAIYGSDAVAGVVNIILRQDIDETVVNVLWGTPTETNSTRGDTRIQLVNGKTFNRGSYTFTAEYANREAILGRHYDKYDDQQDDYPYGEGAYNRSILNLDWFTAYWFGQPSYRDPGELFEADRDTVCGATGRVGAYRNPQGYFCGNTDEGVAGINFRNEKESLSLYFNGQLEIGDGYTELFTDLLYYTSESKSQSPGFFFSEDILDLTGTDPWGDPGDWYLAQRVVNSDDTGNDMSETFEDTAWTAVFGARGVWNDTHDWEASVNYSEYEYESTRPWMKWREAIDNMLGTWLGVGYAGDDWWSGGTLGEDLCSPIGDNAVLFGPLNDCFKNSLGVQTYGNKTTDLYLQFTMSGDLLEMNAGPLSYALVVEYEQEELKFIPDALIQQSPPSTDSEGNPVFGLTGSGWYRLTGYQGDGDRDRYSVGGELRVPVLDTLTLNLAARWDKYDSTSTSFGSDVTPSASLEWRPTNNLLVRAGYTESFRAPDMAQVFVTTGVFTSGFDYVSCEQQYIFINGSNDGFSIADCDSTSIFANRVGAQSFGGDPLDAETGDSSWLGFAWDITNNLSLTVDYTQMELEGRVRTQSIQGLLNDEWSCQNGDQPSTVSCDQVGDQIIRQTDATTGISFIDQFYYAPINQAREEASFIDVKLVYTLNTEAGVFRFQGDYNNMLSHELQVSEDSDVIDLKNDPINGGWDFRSSFIGSLTWAYKDFSTTATMVYRGSTAVRRCTSATGGCEGEVTGEDYLATENWWVDPYITWNWTAAYNITDAFLARVRVVNVFDEDPPYDDTHLFFDQPWYNIFVYPGAGIGRYAALEMEYTFN